MEHFEVLDNIHVSMLKLQNGTYCGKEDREVKQSQKCWDAQAASPANHKELHYFHSFIANAKYFWENAATQHNYDVQ